MLNNAPEGRLATGARRTLGADDSLADSLERRTVVGTLWRSESDRVRCFACGHRCLIADGHRGICKVRFNQGGQLRVPFGYVAGVACDPVEKKPFFHVYPGADALTFGMLGCDFHCSYCQNWVTSQALRDPAAGVPVTAATTRQLVAAARRYGAQLMVSSYNEPLITAEWAVAVFQEAVAAGLKCAFVSNGNATAEVLDYLKPWIVAYKIDLKSFDDKRYRKLGGTLANVTRGIQMVHERGIWLEVVTLLIPGFNDSESELRELTGFLASVSPDIPWHVTAFHADYKMSNTADTTAQQLIRAAEIATKQGLRFVYAGNLPGSVGSWENTHCPVCRQTLVERHGFIIQAFNITAEGKCPFCYAAIPGIWPRTGRAEVNPTNSIPHSINRRPRGVILQAQSIRRAHRSKPKMQSGTEFEQSTIRPAAVAGKFYPSDPADLRRMLHRFIGCAQKIEGLSAKAVVVPHAAYPFSGPVAAAAYVQFCAEHDTIKRIVLIGPSHWVPFTGVALSSAKSFQTPLGEIPVDSEAIQLIRSFPQVSIRDEAHAREHSLEVNLPFLQVVLSDFKIVPLVTGDATEQEMSAIIDQLWAGPETRFVISSDLSHHHDYRTTQELDERTAWAVEQLLSHEIGPEQACGYIGVRGLLAAARQHQLHCQTVDLRNSGDTNGPRNRVVGYGAFVFSQPSAV